jgi:hypothetical protein
MSGWFEQIWTAFAFPSQRSSILLVSRPKFLLYGPFQISGTG